MYCAWTINDDAAVTFIVKVYKSVPRPTLAPGSDVRLLRCGLLCAVLLMWF